MIAIIDYHVGNLGSVTNACKRQGMDVVVTNDPVRQMALFFQVLAHFLQL